MDQKQFVQLLQAAVQHKVSDIHLHPGVPPGFRIQGDLVNVKFAPLAADLQRKRLDYGDPVQRFLRHREKPFDNFKRKTSVYERS